MDHPSDNSGKRMEITIPVYESDPELWALFSNNESQSTTLLRELALKGLRSSEKKPEPASSTQDIIVSENGINKIVAAINELAAVNRDLTAALTAVFFSGGTTTRNIPLSEPLPTHREEKPLKGSLVPQEEPEPHPAEMHPDADIETPFINFIIPDEFDIND